jgi:acid phosphatase
MVKHGSMRRSRKPANKCQAISRWRARLAIEHLEDRNLLTTPPFAHVLLLSVDGLHQADVADPILQSSTTPSGAPVLQNILGLQQQGVTYDNASTTSPSDSFPGELSMLTGAHPGTTGVFYDDSYDRKLLPPAIVGSTVPGTETMYAENLDYNLNNMSGTDGTNGFDASAIDPTQLPLSGIVSVGGEQQKGIVLGSQTIYQLNNSPILNDGTATGSIFGSKGALLATFTIPQTAPDPNLPNSANDIVRLSFVTGGSNFTSGTLNLANGVLVLNWSSTPPPAKTNVRISYNYGVTVSPHQFLKVNTIFNVAQDAGLLTAYSDKHPAYDIASGPNGQGVDDFYAPEINSFAALEDLSTGHTVDANALRDANPFVDLSNYKLVYGPTDPDGPNDPNLGDITKNSLLTEKYDDLKVQAILNEINGLTSRGDPGAGVPALFGMNFQAVSVAQKYSKGGIDIVNGQEVPSNIFLAALQHTDASIGAIENALKAQGLWASTMLVLTAKHGQDPRIGSGIKMADNQIPNVIGANLAQATQDDVSLLWLKDQSQTQQAVDALTNFQATGFVTGNDANNNPVRLPASQVIDKILSGSALAQYKLGDPSQNSRTPDIIVTLKPGFIWVGNPKNKFKRAEHGGFSEDDTHVALIVSSGGLNREVQGGVVDQPVETTQIAVTALHALRLKGGQLKGAAIEKTKELPGLTDDALQNIDHFVVIYQENWSFDGLYGLFPGANGLQNAALAGTIPQVDKFGNPLTTLPNPSTNPPVPGGLPVGPFDLSAYLQPSDHTNDIIHRFYHQQLQIDNGVLEPSNGKLDKFVTWSDNGSLVFSHFDATNLPEGQLAQQFTLDDNFFHAAYGGSFLNHQFLVAATAPQWNQPIPTGFQSSYDPTTHTLVDSKLTIDGKYDVNTTFGAQAPHPAGIPSNQLLNVINDNHPFNPDGSPDPTYTPTIGDRLDTAPGGPVSWKWYSGGWDQALAGQTDPYFTGLFQYHHQPFAYYANYAPLNADGTPNAQNDALLNPNAHLQDETNFFSDLASGNLPSVSFIKPFGPDNEHPGYADLLQGQQHVADIVHAIQNSPAWAHTAVIITYDENGGRWDHVSPPMRDAFGDGSRVPAIVISPYAKQGYVDHQQHDTLSILKTIEDRFGLQSLNQRDANATSLASDFQSTPHRNIGTAYLQPDADNVGQFVLFVGGTEESDHIQIQPAAGNQIEVKIDKAPFDQTFDASVISRIQIYGQGGNDRIEVDPSILLPTQIFAGKGNKFIQTGNGDTSVVGGSGVNHIEGGTGRNILIGGSGRSTIHAHNGEAILVAGTTNFGADAEVLQLLENEWSSTDDLLTRQTKIEAGVGIAHMFALSDQTVHSNGQANRLKGGSGLDWFFANLHTDHIDDMFGQDLFTAIK